MENKLAENIRAFRKDRRLTQEQLAEAMGVTTGAVYKWESGMSVPELQIIMELADFFDVSVDVLLGYKMRDNRLNTTIDRLCSYCRTMSPEALDEAEKALKKYPNSFRVVCACAMINLLFGTEHRDKDYKEKLRRAAELYEQSLLLINQNTDPERGELYVYGALAEVYSQLGEYEKAVELMKKHNDTNIFSGKIGLCLSIYLHRADEAEEYLSDAMLVAYGDMSNAFYGMAYNCCVKKDYAKARELVEWDLDCIRRFNADDGPSFLTKTMSTDYIFLAGISLKEGNKKAAEEELRRARKLVRDFDAAPDFGTSCFRFIDHSKDENTSMHDMLGITAEEGADKALKILGDEELRKMWEKTKKL